MSFLLECPNCGVREVTDFGFGGEVSARPKSRPSFRELNTYNYFRRNVAGVQREWWFHRSGLPRLVHRRARHRHQRGEAGGAAVSRLSSAARRAHRPDQEDLLHLRRQEGRRPTRATRSARRCTPPGSARSAAASSTTAAAGSCACAGPVPQLHLRRRRRPGRPGLHRAGARGHHRHPRQRAAVAGVRRDARHRHLRRPVHAARLLLQDLHPPAQAVAAVREDPAQRRRPGQAARVPARARVAHRVPPPPRRRAGHRRRDRRPATRRSPPRSWAPTWCSPTRAPSPAASSSSRATRSGPARAGRRACREAGVEIIDQRLRAGLLRRAGPGVAARHPAPGPRRAPRLRHRRHRAAAGVRRQRPARRDALRRRPAAGRALRGQPRQARGDRHHVGPRAARGRRRCAASASRSWPSPTCAPRPASCASALRGDGDPRVQRPHGDRGPRQQGGRPRRSSSRSTGGSEHSFECDLVVVSGGTIPATSLLLQAGARSAYDDRRGHFALADAARRACSPPARWRAPTPTRRSRPPASWPGCEAAHALGLGDDASAARAAELRSGSAAPAAPDVARGPAGERRGPRQVLCLLLRGRDQQGRPPLHRGGL